MRRGRNAEDRAPALGGEAPPRRPAAPSSPGEPWLAYAGVELAVGAGWVLLAVAMLHVQARRGRALGTDERI